MANLQLIKTIAEKKNIPITQLAECVGISEQQIHLMVRKNSTKIDTLEKIARALQVSVTVFFDEENAITIDDHSAYAETGGHAQAYDMRGSLAQTPDKDVATLKAEVAHLNALLAEKERFIKHLLGEKMK